MSTEARSYGAIEAGGTKFVVGTGTGPGDITTAQIPTTTPPETIGRAVAWLRSRGPLQAIGIASFGPVELDRNSPQFGYITSTPKEHWQNTDLLGAVRASFPLPIGFDTDVNGAALAESKWGAASGAGSCLYLTVGTGIGGGMVTGDQAMSAVSHPEMGHIRVPRESSDLFAGVCPYHRDCLEGLACGPAMGARWKTPAHQLPPEHPAWELEVFYLAAGVANLIFTLSPACVVLGGGVMRQPSLLRAVREHVASQINGYAKIPPILAPGLGDRSGITGALALAQIAFSRASV